ncbi:hypothetical protein GCM10010435_82450 [Winogradskya consettensis]|uniref:Uncharacterized protein n=1 Tax=Winogradskya consettensis TaxID=113560 RepID=A0A919SUG2_9ACTN|nr:hypothetical protein [Actinoplanes consettensis]GIM79140.1 hypothetical protein Aco04nite_64030 [Actinoplanes consettensis]
MRPGRTIGTAAGLAVWAAIALVWTSLAGSDLGGSPARVIGVGIPLLAGPGLGFVLLLNIADPLLSLVIAVSLGCATLVVGAQISLYSGHWSPPVVIVSQLACTVLISAAASIRGAIAKQRREAGPVAG